MLHAVSTASRSASGLPLLQQQVTRASAALLRSEPGFSTATQLPPTHRSIVSENDGSSGIVAASGAAQRPYVPPLAPPFPSSSRRQSACPAARPEVGTGRKGARVAARSYMTLAGPLDWESSRSDPIGKGKAKEVQQSSLNGDDHRRIDHPGNSRRILQSIPTSTATGAATSDQVAGRPGSRSLPLRPWDKLESVLTAYPDLSAGQAQLVLHLRRHIEMHPLAVPSKIYAHYLDFIWRQGRLVEGEEDRLKESAESLAVLMRFAYRKEDVRTLQSLTERARKYYPRQVRISLRRMGPREHDEPRPRARGLGWPAHRNPEELGIVLRVSLAVKAGRWDAVGRVLREASIDGRRGRTTNAGVSPFLSNALLRYGLLTDQRAGRDALAASSAADEASGAEGEQGKGPGETAKPLRASRKSRRKLRASDDAASHAVEPEDDSSRPRTQAEQDETNAMVELKRFRQERDGRMTAAREETREALLPRLLSELNAGDSSAARHLPDWVLLSTLNSLADSGRSDEVLSLVRGHVAEHGAFHRPTPQSHRVYRPVSEADRRQIDGTTLLNIAMRAHRRNPAVNADGMIRVFEQLTGVTLEGLIRQSSNRRQESHRHKYTQQLPGSEGDAPTAHEDPADVVGARASPQEGSTNPASGRRDLPPEPLRPHLQPDEQTVLYLLASFTQPLFAARWGFNLVRHITARFPTLLLTTRSYRRVLEQCVANHKASLVQTVLEHYRLHLTRQLHDQYSGDPAVLQAQVDAVVGRGRKRQSATMPALVGRRRNEWRQTLVVLAKRGWITRDQKVRYMDLGLTLTMRSETKRRVRVQGENKWESRWVWVDAEEGQVDEASASDEAVASHPTEKDQQRDRVPPDDVSPLRS